MSSASPSNSDVARGSRHFALVPNRTSAKGNRVSTCRSGSSLLKPKPGYREIDAGDHCDEGNDASTPCPKPAQAIWQERGNKADYESADRSKSNPSVPIHLGCEEIQDGIGNIPRTMSAEKDDALRWINGKQREPASSRNTRAERESCPKGKGKPAIRRSGHYYPNPPMLFTT